MGSEQHSQTKTSPTDTDEETEAVLALFTDAIRAGKHPSVAELVAANPHLAQRIRALIPPLVEIERLAATEDVTLADKSIQRRTGKQNSGPR